MQYVKEDRLADEEKLNALALDLYRSSGRCFTPVFPWVFVRVLPKEQITPGGVVMPHSDQNKTVHEGIVLATWAPIKVVPKPRRTDDDHHWAASVSTAYAPITQESDLKPGDHVLFPHWAGLPIEGFSEKRYRVVKETAWRADTDGGIFAQVEYTGTEERVHNQLSALLPSVREGNGGQLGLNDILMRKIEEKFVLIERGGYSVTLSGR